MFRAGQRMSDESWSGLRTMTTGTAGSSSQPSQVANWARSGIATAPGMCPAAMSATGRTSTATAPPASSRRAAATSSGLRVGSPMTRSGPRRLTSASQPKYAGYEPRPAWSWATKVSASGACSSGLVALSRPMVEVRAAPGGAEQNDPVPWVGHTAAASGRAARRCSDSYWARASSSVRSAPSRSVRAAEPTISDPPVNTPTGVAPSRSRNDRCSSVCPGVARACRVSPPRSTSSPSASPRWSNRRCPAAETRIVAPWSAASWRAPVRKSACRWVSAAYATRKPRRVAARRARRSRGASTANARPSPRSSRYALLPSPSSTSGIRSAGSMLTPVLPCSVELAATVFHGSLEERVGDPARKTELFDRVARVGKALGSGKRLELLDLLAQGERSVEALARAAGLGLTTASAHLQILKQAGLVATRRDGTRIHYRLADAEVADLYARLRDVAAAHLADVDAASRAYLGPSEEGISRDELLRRARSGDVVVLDVRPVEEYAAGHIAGAVSIPVDELAERIAELPEGVEVVAYCRARFCVFAHDAVRLLATHGRPARRLEDGMLEWRLAGLPVAA